MASCCSSLTLANQSLPNHSSKITFHTRIQSPVFASNPTRKEHSHASPSVPPEIRRATGWCQGSPYKRLVLSRMRFDPAALLHGATLLFEEQYCHCRDRFFACFTLIRKTI